MRTNNFSKPPAHVPDVCPKCGQRSIIIDRNTNGPRCSNMICGYRAKGNRSQTRVNLYRG
jgi:hypothetical protein